jgi:Icc-related predicted phosphoesterase
VIRRLSLSVPRPVGSGGGPAGEGRTVRLLAVSDEVDRAFDFESNREAIRPLDAILGCGDLEPEHLCFLADAFHVPLLYVLGNHDRGANWESYETRLPGRLDGRVERVAGISVAGMSWPGTARGRPARDDLGAWRQVIGLALKSAARRRPLIILSHVPPSGLGDTPEDPFHRGFGAYRWLLRALSPIAWLHGHTALAASEGWRTQWRSTTLVNVTGAVLLEITVGSEAAATIAEVEA